MDRPARAGRVDRGRYDRGGRRSAPRASPRHRVEAFVQDLVLLFNLLQKNPGLKMAGLQPFRPGRYGLAVRKGDKEWLDFINATLTKMKETGDYDKLLDKWFGPEAGALRRLFEPEK